MSHPIRPTNPHLKQSRRAFLKNSAALAAATAVLRNSGAWAAPDQPALAATPLDQFDYADVQLLDGPMLEQFHHNLTAIPEPEEDSLLKPFRQLAGQAAPGEDMGGWYSPSQRIRPSQQHDRLHSGHSFGQYLSGLARAYAVTGDKATQEKVRGLVADFAPTVTTKFYDGYCIPAYTFDKTNCGLIDAHQFAGDPMALAVLNKATDAVLPWLPEKALNREEMMARPHKNISFTWDETYTLPENFYLAYQRGAGARFHSWRSVFLKTIPTLVRFRKTQCASRPHAYSHVNALCSAMQAYLTDDSDKHLRRCAEWLSSLCLIRVSPPADGVPTRASET